MSQREIYIPPTLTSSLETATNGAGYHHDLAEQHLLEGNIAYERFAEQKADAYQKKVDSTRATINAFLSKREGTI